ncbi:hypothetical protein [Nocardia mangyaensis]|uniref:hypothetical protein n=1 Tax=Nocardia mangyaensis TaxID=2213200 RepID=UPI0026753ED7|nr:hypothetical protein [Nocardia mangyaensis]MDO3650661.1 hypothetical protein [Nocardia mangyaensis]
MSEAAHPGTSLDSKYQYFWDCNNIRTALLSENAKREVATEVTDLVTRAQITMLAELLDVEPDELRSLERLGAADVEALRQRISDTLFDSLASVFTRVGKLAPLVPDALAATVAMKAIPPEVAGRAGGAVGMAHQHRAAGLMARMTPTYLADAAPYVDPRVIPVFAPLLPFTLLLPAADELLRRRDYPTAARFVEYATDELIREFERHVQDDIAIISTGAMVSRTEVLNTILRTVSAERRERLAVAGAAGEPEVLAAMLSLLSRIDAKFASPMSAAFFEVAARRGLAEVCALILEVGADGELLDIMSYLPGEAVSAVFAAVTPADLTSFERAATTGRRKASWLRLAVSSPEAAAQ